MLDLKFIRENEKIVRDAIAHKGEDVALDRLLLLDSQRRDLLSEVDKLKHQRNEVSEEIARLKRSGESAEAKIEGMKAVSDQIKDFDRKIREVEGDLDELLLTVPNIPHSSVPVGRGEGDNVVVKEWGDRPDFDFQPRNHIELGRMLDILDFERGSKVAGAAFPLYKGLGAKLERSLINFMLDLHIDKHGYREVLPPLLANRMCMIGTGQLPKLEDDMYLCQVDDLFLIPTAEVPVTNLHREELLSGEDLPIYYVAYTPCFRREAGSYGKETKGFLRVHQFNKVELVKYVLPEDSYRELEGLLGDAEEVLQLLGIPYRVSVLCTGDLSFAAAKCYDIEGWAMGEEKYLEISSCSNYEDFQARRAMIRFRRHQGERPEFVHTLNGSGVATSRLMVALLENYQTARGTVIVPQVLRPFMGVEEIC